MLGAEATSTSLLSRALARTSLSVALLLLVGLPEGVDGQWTNRYPKVDGYRHHVYLEGYELPVLNAGPIDPTVSPDGARIAFSARGWIWVMKLGTGTARRVTRGRDLDFRPAWSPDGRRLAFVRDDDHDTSIWLVDADGGQEELAVDTPAIDLDPAFTSDGKGLLYSSGVAGDLDLWRVDLESDEKQRLTSRTGVELAPRPHRDGRSVVYLTKQGGPDRVTIAPLLGDAGESPEEEARVLAEGAILSMTRPALSPDGGYVALALPSQQGWELRLADVRRPERSVLLADGLLPLTPAWGPEGHWIYFAEADREERMGLKRVSLSGGDVESVPVRAWNWEEPTTTIRVRTTIHGRGGIAPVRLSVVDRSGHPTVPDSSAPHFDGQNGRVFFYSPGVVELTVPVGPVTVSAVQGLETPEVTRTVTAGLGGTNVDLELTPVWDARAEGWMSGEHHFHLNYGGQYDLDPGDLIPMMEGENLDVVTPLLANLHNRFEDQGLWGWTSPGQRRFIRFGQEIRSHFLGHLGLIGIQDLHWPWVWGPGYEVYGSDDRTNADVLDFAAAQGGFSYYVHPYASSDPFSPEGRRTVPVELVADAVLGEMDGLEIVCLWSDEVGTGELWYRFLNLGSVIVPTAGTDIMTDYYRTMALGSTRVYTRTEGGRSWSAYLTALKQGRSFVTSGPLIDFEIEGQRPGGVVDAGEARWRLEVNSSVPVERVELLVNGTVVSEQPGLEDPGSRSLTGELELPSGGWVAARASGGETRWPAMDSYPFAHTAPVWIERVGSTEPAAQQAAARDLLQVLEESTTRLRDGYAEAEIPHLEAHFARARNRLEELAAGMPQAGHPRSGHPFSRGSRAPASSAGLRPPTR